MSLAGQDFGEFLVDMLYDMDPAQPNRTSSRGRQVYYHSTKDWSPTIWELLEITAAKALRYRGKTKGLYDRDLSRLGGGVLHMILDTADFYSQMPPGHREELAAAPEGDGISILIIETRSND
jgi:hypothetical protein